MTIKAISVGILGLILVGTMYVIPERYSHVLAIPSIVLRWFIGSCLVKELPSQSHVTVIDNLSNKKSRSNVQILKDNSISFFQDDIMQKEKITEIIKICSPDACVHLAAKISVPESMLDPPWSIDKSSSVRSFCVSVQYNPR